MKSTIAPSTLMAYAVLGGGCSALLHLSPLPGLFFLSYFASLPFFLLGLSLGLRPLYGAGCLATAFIFLLEGPLFGLEFFLFFFLGPLFLVNQALLKSKKPSGKVIWYSSSFLLRDLTLAASIAMVMALGFYLYLTQAESVQALVKTLLKTLDSQNHMREAELFLIKAFPYLPGIFSFSWTIMMLINGLMAQSILTRFHQNLRPSPTLENIEIPKSFLGLLAGSLFLATLGIGSLALLGKSAMFIFVFPFFLVGLGLVHRWFHKTSFATLGLTLFYCLLLLFLWPVLFVILLGILKPFIEKASS